MSSSNTFEVTFLPVTFIIQVRINIVNYFSNTVWNYIEKYDLFEEAKQNTLHRSINFPSKHGTSALQFFKLNAPARSACQGLTAPKTPK